MSKTDTIVAIATAAGRSGIGVVRLSGQDLSTLVQRLLGRLLAARRATLTNFLGANEEVIDRGIALYFPAPQSYTGEDVLELQGHGGPTILQLLLARCVSLGARVAEPGEFTKRAYLNGKLDLAQAEAVADLIEASTAHAARAAMQSLQGVFSARISELVRDLIDLRVRVEAVLDFPDEDVGGLNEGELNARLAELHDRINGVLAASRQGSLLREGIRVALVGRPNVGKSSLLNQLAGEELAIVTGIPGTTRDAIRLSVEVDGVPVHFFDTAGLRSSLDPVEKLGIARTWSVVEQADLVALMMEANEGETAADREILGKLPRGIRCLRIFNKIDLTDTVPHTGRNGECTSIWLSARTGAGIDNLRKLLLELAGWEGQGEGVFTARARHVEALGQARAHLEQARNRELDLELIAEELRLAQSAMGSITGEYTSDELLGDIFSRFCIGK
jgi:tRNA modification GTPase